MISLFTAFFLSAVLIFTHVRYDGDLYPKEVLVSNADTGIQLLDSKDRPFFSFYQAKFKKEISLYDIPEVTRRAIIVAEDKDFYTHNGFSIKAIIRSFIDNVEGRTLSFGGSTITQQLVKNFLLSPKKSLLRKYQEVILANELERKYSKNQILEMYLNSVYFGENSFGIEAAANTYFNKKANELDLAQSTILAAVLPAPSRLSLFNGNLNEAKKRQELILERMVKQGFITKAQKEAALKEDLALVPHGSDINIIAPHFALMVRDELIRRYGEDFVARSGFKVRTTLDLDWQKYAEQVVAKQVENLKANNATNGAAVVMDPKTSEVKALVGSKDWNDNSFGKVNIALSPRPSGSAFKPIVYVRAFEKNLITTATILRDEPTTFDNFDRDKFFASYPNKSEAQLALQRDPNAFYKPVDYDRKYRGLVTVRRALANSLNIPSVAIIKRVGVEEALESAKNLGLTGLKDPSNYGLSLVLGTAEVRLLELTNAYAVFAGKGYRNDPTLILEITDKKNNLVYKYKPDPKQVIDEKYAFLISSILSDNKTRSEVFGTTLNISRLAAVKTGTTEDFKDAWTIGYTPSLVVGVWVGNNFGERMDGVAGSLGAAPIWKSLMEKFLAGTPVEEFIPPEGIVKVASCGLDLSLKISSYSATPDYFVKGTESSKSCRFTQPVATQSAALPPKI